VPIQGFFVLTGFLLAYPLLADAKKTSGESLNKLPIKDWWYRRISRMVPLYAILVVVSWYVRRCLLWPWQ
jgi:peptidoglycan/LPS O-acetylase OafA/YrhL